MHRTHLALMMIAVLIIPTSLAGHTLPRQDDGFRNAEREIDLQTHRNGFQWTAMDTVGNETLGLSFDAEAGTLQATVSTPEVDHQVMRIDLDSIVEFQDADADGRMGLGDPIIHHVRWSDLRGVNTVKDQDDAYSNVTSIITSVGGSIRLEVTASFRQTTGGTALPDVGVSFHVEKFPFKTDNRTMLAIMHRINGTVDVHGASGAVQDGPYLVRMQWGDPPGNVTGVTAQTYGTEENLQTLFVQSQGREDTDPFHLTLGFHKVEEDFWTGLRDIRLSDWRLWAIGVLIAGLIVTVSVAREYSKGPK